MNPAFTAVTRREYIPVGSAPASMLATVTTANTGFMSSEFFGQQWNLSKRIQKYDSPWVVQESSPETLAAGMPRGSYRDVFMRFQESFPELPDHLTEKNCSKCQHPTLPSFTA
jgi:hypothetical protein